MGISLNQIFKKSDENQYICQETDCLYTLHKHRFYTSIAALSGKNFKQLSRVVQKKLEVEKSRKNTKHCKETTRSKKLRETLSKF